MQAHDKEDKQDNTDEQPAKPRKIGLFWSVANIVLRQVVNTSPREMKDDSYPGEHVPDEVDHENKTATANVKYILKEVLMQPTPHTCGDATALMILQFQRNKLAELLTDSAYELSDMKKHVLQETLKILQKKAKQIDYYTQNESEVQQRYCVMQLRMLCKFTHPDDFAKSLAFHLYERGPLYVSIKTRPYHLTSHAVLVYGVMNNHVLYADAWDGEAKTMTVAKFAKKFSAAKDPSVMSIAVPGYSYALLNSLPKAAPENPPESKMQLK